MPLTRAKGLQPDGRPPLDHLPLCLNAPYAGEGAATEGAEFVRSVMPSLNAPYAGEGAATEMLETAAAEYKSLNAPYAGEGAATDIMALPNITVGLNAPYAGEGAATRQPSTVPAPVR